jgi:hypothetical protein
MSKKKKWRLTIYLLGFPLLFIDVKLAFIYLILCGVYFIYDENKRKD